MYVMKICDALRDSVPLVQFKKLQAATSLKETLLHGCFSGFLNSTNGTKSHKASHMNSETDAQPVHVEKIQTKQFLLSSKVSSTH